MTLRRIGSVEPCPGCGKRHRSLAGESYCTEGCRKRRIRDKKREYKRRLAAAKKARKAMSGAAAARYKMPEERKSVTHRFTIGGLKVYVIVGLRENGEPGELFIRASKLGSFECGLLHALGMFISEALKYGMPLPKAIEKMRYMRFDPAGVTSSKKIPLADSVIDYLGRWLQQEFIDRRTEQD